MRLRRGHASSCERLPQGRVIAVDAAPSMVEHARQALGDRATVFLSDLRSSCWTSRSMRPSRTPSSTGCPTTTCCSRRMHAALRPGGRLSAQCGGKGNIEGFHGVAAAVGAGRAVRRAPLRLAGPVELRRGRGDARAPRARRLHGGRDLASAVARHAARPAAFIRTVCLGPHLERLPEELAGALRGGRPRALGAELDYVRLNIHAQRRRPLNGGY